MTTSDNNIHCMACGQINRLAAFQSESFTITLGGRTSTIGSLAGERCSACGEVFFDASSTKAYAAAGDALVIDERGKAHQ